MTDKPQCHTFVRVDGNDIICEKTTDHKLHMARLGLIDHGEVLTIEWQNGKPHEPPGGLMVHEYTDDQVNEAIMLANRTGKVYAWETEMYRSVIKHLPKPQDDWQECGFSDLRPTDKRVKAVFIGGSIIEGTPDQSSSESIFLVDGPVIHTYDDATFYRIPAPVQHPDPEEHPVIANVAVHKPGTNSTHRYDYATWDIGEYYDCWSNDGKYYGAWRPVAIVEWSPAKVVADND